MVVISVVASGFVSLFIGRAIEVSLSNDQRVRNITNCQKIQEDRHVFAQVYGTQADQVLGNPKKHIPPLNIDNSSLKDFKPLIITQALTNRKLSVAFASRIENCDQVFPKRRTFWIF
jgi:hypothetical protein